MSLPFTMRRSSEEVPSEDAIREKRVQVARANPVWSEVAETLLVRRERWLVHAETDETFTRFAAQVWARGTAVIAQNDRVPLTFFVDQQGEVHFLERQAASWSEIFAKRTRRPT